MEVELLTIRRNALIYTILSVEDRAVIATLRKEGHSLQSITNKTNFAKSTIHYELRQISPYIAQKVHQLAIEFRMRCGRKLPLPDAQNSNIEDYYLDQTYSPNGIAHTLSTRLSNIYAWLHKGLIDYPIEKLPLKNDERSE